MSELVVFSRRTFIRRGVGMLSVAATVPVFIDRSAICLAGGADGKPAARAERVLVVVQLAGGNDGLNMIVPLGNDDYYKARPRIGIAKNAALKLTDDFGVHPSATGLKKLFDGGTLGILHAVGYPNANRSHFRATDIWTTGEPERVAHAGWLGKYCDACCSGQDPGKPAGGGKSKVTKSPDPATAIALEAEPPKAIIGKNYIPLTFRAPESLAYHGAHDAGAAAAFAKLNAGMLDDNSMEARDDDDHRPPHLPMGTAGSLAQDDDAARFLQRSALNARLYASRIQKSTAAIHNAVEYPPTAFAQDMKLVAQMIASDLPTRIYYVKLGGFDTHSNQVQRHEKLMAEMAAGLATFTDDLKAMGHLERVVVMTFSEFGRRVSENGSAGTDHGEAAPLLVLGGKIKPGFHGDFPSLAANHLHRGDMPYTTDFRSLYATLLKDWMGADPAVVLGKTFKTLDLIGRA